LSQRSFPSSSQHGQGIYNLRSSVVFPEGTFVYKDLTMGRIPTGNCEAAYEFYVGRLQLKLLSREGDSLKLASGQDTFWIVGEASTTPSADPVLGWEVANVEEAVRWLRGRGIAVEHTSGRTNGFFKDPDGNLLVVIQRP